MALFPRPNRRAAARKHVRIAVEHLEDRTAPALFNVQSPQTFTSSLNNNGFLASGDWNLDGKKDIVLTNYGDGTAAGAGKSITFLYGTGDGKFGSPITQNVGGSSDSVSFLAVGDLNGDGNLDIVTCQTNQTTQGGTMTVFMGAGGGAFNKMTPFASGGNRPAWVGIGDFTGDGKPDVAVVNMGDTGAAGGRNISIFKGAGDANGTLTGFYSFTIPDADGVGTAGAIADFNNDGKLDLAVTFCNVPPDDLSPQVNGSVRVFTNKGDGSLDDANNVQYETGSPMPISIVAADFSGDGKPDMIVANAGDPDNLNAYLNFGKGTAVSTFQNSGSGAFGPATLYNVGFKSAFAVAVSDLNMDGKLDFAVCDLGYPSLFGTPTPGGVAVFLGKTSGVGFLADPTSPYSTTIDTAQYLVIDSFNSDTDATPDIVVAHEARKIVTMLNTSTPAAGTTTTITGSPSPSGYGTAVTFTANVSSTGGTPTGTVTFFDGGTQIGTGTLAAGVATFNTSTLNAGVHSVTAKYEGAAGFSGSTSTAWSQTVNAAATTTSVVAAPSPATFGQSVTFTATVGSAAGTPTGTVTFFVDGVSAGTGNLSGGNATFNTSALSVGKHSITADYAASGNFAASSSTAFSLTVDAAATTTTLVAAPSPATFGANVTLTATIASTAGLPTGTVTFFDGATQLGTGTISTVSGKQQATFSTTAFTTGVHNLTATYAASGNFAGSTSAVFPLTVNGVATTVAISSSLNPSLFSQSVTITATVSAAAGTPTGTVNFFEGATLLGSGTLATVGGQQQTTFTSSTLPVGTHPIVAKYVGAGQFNPANSPTLDQVVNAVTTTTTLESSLNPAPVGDTITFTAKVLPTTIVPGTLTGTVTFKDGTTTLGTGTIAGGVATFQTSTLPAGSHTITAVYGGDAGFTGSTSAGLTQTVSVSNPGLVGYREFGVGAGAGASANTRFFNPDGTERFNLNVFPGFTGGVRVTSADFNGDGIADLVAGTGPGSSTHVVVIDGKTKAQLFAFDPFEASFTGGVFVAAGDITGDGTADLVVSPDEGGGPRVRIIDGTKFALPLGQAQINDFFGIDDPNFRGGARSAVGDVNGDGKADLYVAAGFGGGPRVAVFDGANLSKATPPKLFGDFFMFEQTLRNGVYIAGGDLNGDGLADVIGGGGPDGGPRIYALSAADLLIGKGDKSSPLANFFAGDINNRGGIRVVARDLDGDAKADLVVGAGVGAGSLVTGYLGVNIAPNNNPLQDFAFDAYPGFAGGVFVG